MDTNLQRQVAIKVLPASVASDAERLGRFQREVEVLAELNHPNIAAIYGLEGSSGITALVRDHSPRSQVRQSQSPRRRTVKALDLGLAKATDPAATSSADAMNSPTVTARATQMGMLLGTSALREPAQNHGADRMLSARA